MRSAFGRPQEDLEDGSSSDSELDETVEEGTIPGEQDESHGEHNESHGEQDESHEEQDESHGKQDESHGEQDESPGEQDESPEKQDESPWKTVFPSTPAVASTPVVEHTKQSSSPPPPATHPKRDNSTGAKVEKGKSQPEASNELDPNVKRALIVGGVTVASCLGAVVAAPLVLAATGFGAAGIVAGSVAAGWQAVIGNVVAGSFFAALQSAGVVGLASSTVAAVGAAGAAGGAIVSGVATGLMDQKERKDDEPGPSSAPQSANFPNDDDDDETGFSPGSAIVPSGKNK